ncbi:MAG: beta tubulin [Hyphomicrobiales bacterium]|nr:MAG: beta tubulin [Hyphomicrobiales bacterium]
MRTVSQALGEHLSREATTLCRCWRIVRTDGAEYGFTDHDRELGFADIAFSPAVGLSASETTAGSGLAVGGHEVAGAFALNGFSDADLKAGLWDNAEVTVWLVNWNMVSERLVIGRGNLGEITQEDDAFRAEIRSLSHQLDQPRGRLFSRHCDATLGDARCGVDNDDSAYMTDGAVTGGDGRRRITVSGLAGFEDGWFSRGLLEWTTGANAGARAEIKAHTRAATITLSLWQATAEPIEAGDAFIVRAGCDKCFETCIAKFANTENFRGFPHMPGNDFVLSYPEIGEDSDGEALL